ncbi:MAG: NUDIX hydrolase [Patescibacteria group bacterium]|jgi:8-oxo-dGTP pyrophosphatase MutT (NUDIX family)|nr:NUDIX hydrolase [Patescibacteria group bacterium]
MDIKDYKIINCGGGIVINDKNQIAIIYMADMGTWDFPKGGVENDESFYDTSKREIYEEAGIKNLVFIKKLPIYKRPASNGKTRRLHTLYGAKMQTVTI